MQGFLRRFVICSSSRRCFSTRAGPLLLKDMDASTLTIETTRQPKSKPKDSKDLVFGKTTTDHILRVRWHHETGWDAGKIEPYAPLALDPAASCLHYGLECFEGMKAYVDAQDQVRLFRPEMNMKRMNHSCERLSLPTFDGTQALEMLKELVRLEKDWIPRERNYSLYIRPTMISTTPFLGVMPPTEALWYVITCPVGPYYPEGFKPVGLYADTHHVRAHPGGVGDCKVGGNYAASLMPQRKAIEKGYSQVLWLFGPEHEVTEVGTMNLFVYWINEQGEKELITYPLERNLILHGVTRDSILALTRSWNECKVSERPFNMKQIRQAAQDGRLLEIFGAGTAAIVSPVNRIHYEGQDIDVPCGQDGNAGELSLKIFNELLSIQMGEKEHEWSMVI